MRRARSAIASSESYATGPLPASPARKIFVAASCAAAVLLTAACRERSFYTGALKPDPTYAQQLSNETAAREFVKAARNMTPEQLAAVQKRTQSNPEDLDARRKLMLYYQAKARPPQGQTNESMLAALRAQKLLFIEHHPENDYALLANPAPDPEGDRAAEKRWRAVAARRDAPPAALRQAGFFFEPFDKHLSEELLLRSNGGRTESVEGLYASVLAGPEVTTDFGLRVRKTVDGSKDPKLLGSIALIMARQYSGPQRAERARIVAQAQSYAERALALDPNQPSARTALAFVRMVQFSSAIPDSTWNQPVDTWASVLSATPELERFRWLARMSARAYDRGEHADLEHNPARARADWQAARTFAQVALQLASRLPSNPNYGTVIYQANMTLGMVAMRVDGNTKAAARYMLTASAAPATDELRYDVQWFTLKLPVAALKYGRLDGRQAVIEYLERFGKILRRPDLSLLQNAAELRKGYMPIWYPYQAARLKGGG